MIKARAKEALTKEYPMSRVVEAPVEVKVVFTNAVMADVVSLIPSFERVDGVTMKGVYDDYQKAIFALRAGISMAGGTNRR